MKKLVLLLFVLTAFAFGVQGQSSTAADKATDATNRSNASGTKVNSDGTQPSSIQNQNSTNDSKSLTVEKKGCFKISSVSLASGLNKYRTMNHTGFDDENANYDHGNWNSGNYGFMNGRNMGTVTSRNQVILEMGLNPWSKKLGEYNKKRELIIGLFYSGADIENYFSEKYASTPGDTFSFNSVKYRTDTVSNTRHSYNREANVLGGRVEYLFKSDPERRFSVFTGVGLDVAYTITSRTLDVITKDSLLVLNFYENSPIDDQGYNFYNVGNQTSLGSEILKNEIHKGDPAFFTGVSVPFGINLRICKKKEVLNQFSLFMKGRLGVEAEFAMNHNPRFNPYMGMSLGLKFDFK